MIYPLDSAIHPLNNWGLKLCGFRIVMASPCKQTFLSSLTERKRKRSDISEGLERLKNVSLSELSDLCSVLSKDDILWLLAFLPVLSF